MAARTLEVEIRKVHQWGPNEGKEYRVEPNSIPEDKEPGLIRDLVTKLYPRWSPIALGREQFYGRATFGYGDKGTYSLFFKTLQDCFNMHLPFALRPEVLWYLVVHEVATAVRLNPERYRLYFSSSKDKILTTLNCDSYTLPTDWSPVIAQFGAMLQDQMPTELGSILCSEFSTSSAETNAATNVAFMEAASPFYDYRMRLLCGLPLIRLEGEVADYVKLAENARALKLMFGKDLGLYFTHLIPVLDKIAEQAAGAPVDHEFWGAIYNHDSGSGGSDGSDDLGGWITTFVNYVRTLAPVDEHSHFGPAKVTVTPKPEAVFDWHQKKRWLTVGMVPNHVSAADFLLAKPGTDFEVPMKFIGGMLGVDIDDGYVSPKLSYGVLVGESDKAAIIE